MSTDEPPFLSPHAHPFVPGREVYEVCETCSYGRTHRWHATPPTRIDPPSDSLVAAASRVVEVWNAADDLGAVLDLDLDALNEAITALHVAVEMADG